MQQYLATSAAGWIEQTLLPIAISAAGLPAETTADDVLKLDLAQPNHTFYADSMAVMRCAALQLLGATLVATQLAQSERAARIAQSITGLMWRDALEVAIARDLDVDTSLAGFPSGEFQLRHDLAQERWERWQATDAEVSAAITSFLLACGEGWDDFLLAAQQKLGG